MGRARGPACPVKENTFGDLACVPAWIDSKNYWPARPQRRWANFRHGRMADSHVLHAHINYKICTCRPRPRSWAGRPAATPEACPPNPEPGPGLRARHRVHDVHRGPRPAAVGQADGHKAAVGGDGGSEGRPQCAEGFERDGARVDLKEWERGKEVKKKYRVHHSSLRPRPPNSLLTK